jgi:hypothetical protein
MKIFKLTLKVIKKTAELFKTNNDYTTNISMFCMFCV